MECCGTKVLTAQNKNIKSKSDSEESEALHPGFPTGSARNILSQIILCLGWGGGYPMY